jgi:hypothetical protein
LIDLKSNQSIIGSPLDSDDGALGTLRFFLGLVFNTEHQLAGDLTAPLFDSPLESSQLPALENWLCSRICG